VTESRLERALGLIDAQYGRRPGPAEAAAETAINAGMGTEKQRDPDPYPAELRHALIIGDEEACDWLAHTPEGKRLYRRRAQWLGRMRRRRAIQEQVVRRHGRFVAGADCERHRPRRRDHRRVRPRARRVRRAGARAGPRQADGDPEPDLAVPTPWALAA
jgi:hypothetical protein